MGSSPTPLSSPPPSQSACHHHRSRTLSSLGSQQLTSCTSRRRTGGFLSWLIFRLCVSFCATILATTTFTAAQPQPSVSNSSNFRNPTSSPVNGDGTVILDVGQKTVVSSQDAALATILILLGLMQVFFGFRLIRITLVITGFISWAIIVMILMATFQWESVYYFFTPSKYYFWMWLLAGLVGAILCFRFWNLGVTFSGAFGGFAVSMGIIAVSHPHMSTVGQYILLAFLVLFGAAIATFYERYSIIVGTSCGGAFMFMYGVDEIVQVGYREMIVIFEFEGKTLMYHTNPKVIVMIGCSLALALLGIAWEFWHHEKPLWLNQRALFRIYGRPFGKRPEKLAGQRIKEMDWYNYLMGCLCLRRKTAEEVLYEDFDDDLPKKTKKEEEQHQVTVEVAEEEMVVVEDGFVVMVSDLEAAAVISGQDSKTMISGTDQEDASEKPMSLSGLAPVQVVVEEIEYELEDGDGKVVSVEAFSETIVQTNREGTVSEAMYISSTTRTEQQQHTTTSSVSATTTAISSSHAASSIMTTTTYIAESESTPEPL